MTNKQALDALEEIRDELMCLGRFNERMKRFVGEIESALTRPEPVNADLLEALNDLDVELDNSWQDQARMVAIKDIRDRIMDFTAAEAQPAQTVVEGLEGAVERWLVDGCICPKQEDMMTVLEAARLQLARQKGGV